MKECKYDKEAVCQYPKKNLRKESCFVCLANHLSRTVDHLVSHILDLPVKMREAGCIHQTILDMQRVQNSIDGWFKENAPPGMTISPVKLKIPSLAKRFKENPLVE
ncbi:MAG: hypothetical protein HWN68_02375 [Desulfobacterales bacterium]|nr:hypothetical protein [Desulfobacterales bacterium]